MLKNLVYLAVFTTFVIAVWIGLTIYHNFSTTTISEVAQIQIVPIDPSFNPEAVSRLKQRRQIVADLSSDLFIASDPEEEEEEEEATNAASLNPQAPIPFEPPSETQSLPVDF